MEVLKIGTGIAVISNKCPFCHRTPSVIVFIEDLKKYEKGALAQDAFRYRSASEREFIVSGICPTCQRKIFFKQ